MSHYSHHLFFCCNQREDGKPCCEAHGATALRNYCKDRIKGLGLAGVGKVRVNQAGCLDRCGQGPVLVIYPEAVWYTYANREDIDAIIDTHLLRGGIVERLKI